VSGDPGKAYPGEPSTRMPKERVKANVTACIENLRKVGYVSRIDHPTTLISRMNAPTTRWSGF
jgi:hypothetical protein